MDEPETFHPLAQTTRAQLQWQYQGQNCVTSVYYRWAGGTTPSITQLTSLASEVFNYIGGVLRATQNNTANLQAVETRNMDSATGLNYTYAPAGPFPGGRSGNPGPGNVAGRVYRKSTLSGRSKRGAVQVSAFSDEDTVGNDLGSALMGLLIQVALQLLVDRVGGVFLPSTLSFKLASSSILGSAGVRNPFVDSQKTRLTSHGT